MNIVREVARTGGSAANAVWQMSIVPVQALGRRAPRKGTAAFYLAAAGAVVVGAVDLPVAVLVTGAYLAARQTRPATPALAPVGSPVAHAQPAANSTAPASAATAGPAPSAPTSVEPWPGYEQATAAEILTRLADGTGDPETVLAYETGHRDRKTVITAAAAHSPAAHAPVPLV